MVKDRKTDNFYIQKLYEYEDNKKRGKFVRNDRIYAA